MKKISLIIAFCLLLIALLPNAALADAIFNPVGNLPSGAQGIAVIIGRVIQAALGFFGSLALFMFVYAGFVLMTSAGDKEKISKGKNTIIWAIIGMAVVIAAYTLVQFIINALQVSGGV